MFMIIGGDGQEYGPATASQIRGWIADGRADFETKARRVDSDEWGQLGDYAEFSPAAAPGTDRAPPERHPPEQAFEATTLHSAELPELASRGLRLGAALIDGVLKALCWIPSALSVWREISDEVKAGEQPSVETMSAAMNNVILESLPFLIALLVVQCVFLTMRGQSIGKLLLGLRIVRVKDDRQAGFLHAFFLRGVIPGMIEQIPLLGGLFWLVDVGFIFGEERRCLHDYLAGTKVVRV